jgi:signal transduction histidine kinase
MVQSVADSAAWFGGRRAFALVSAVVAAVIAVVSAVELDEVEARDVVAVVAPVGSYLAYGAVRWLPAWAPLTVAWFSVAVVNLPVLRAEGAFFFLVLGLAHLALNEPRRLIVFVCALVTVAMPGVVAVSSGADFGWQHWMIGCGFGWGLGELGFRLRLARDELARTRALIADQAVLDERQRIARDVHDVLGHSLTIIMLQLTAARHLLNRDSGEADAALADAERVGRESLSQVRATVGMLRTEPASLRDGGPSPTLEDLGRLLGDYRAAGISVRAEVSGPVATLDTSRSVAGFRIVQEALANVSKHSPDAETRVRVCVDAEGGACRSPSTAAAAASVRPGPRAGSVWSACGNGPDRSAAPSTPVLSRAVGGWRPSCPG